MAGQGDPAGPTAVLWRLETPAPPPLSQAYRVAALCRRAAMGLARRLHGPDGVPFTLHGHHDPQRGGEEGAAAGRPLHRHAFYLPFDATGGGRLDHVLIHAPGGLDRASVAALAAVERVYDGTLADWPVRCVRLGPVEAMPVPPAARAAVWRSATPWLHTLHAKGVRRGPAVLLARDLAHRGFPAPLRVEECAGPRVDGRVLGVADFVTRRRCRATRRGGRARRPS